MSRRDVMLLLAALIVPVGLAVGYEVAFGPVASPSRATTSAPAQPASTSSATVVITPLRPTSRKPRHPSSHHYAADISTGTQVVGALAIITGAVLAYRRFFRERPYTPRADVTLTPELFAGPGCDVLIIRTSVTSRGKAQLVIMREGAVRPFAAVFGLYEAMLPDAIPETDADWAQHGLWAAYILNACDTIEAGETVGESAIAPVGERSPDLLAYRVESWISVIERRRFRKNGSFSWGEVRYVPVSLVAHKVHTDNEEVG